MNCNVSTSGELSGVVMAFDENYAKHGGCTVLSLIELARQDFKKLYVVSVDLSDSTKRFLLAATARFDTTIEFIELSTEDILRAGLSLQTDGRVEVDYVTPATYARLFLDRLLPEAGGRYLYLDADTIVTGRLNELANARLEYGLGAVADPGIPTLLDPEGLQCPELVQNVVDGPYFNAGVLLIDLDVLRANRFFSRARRYARNARGRMLLYDQEALNAAANGRYDEIGCCWNYMTHGDRGVTIDLTAVRIRHFCSHVKPWDDPAYDQDSILYTERESKLDEWGWH